METELSCGNPDWQPRAWRLPTPWTPSWTPPDGYRKAAPLKIDVGPSDCCQLLAAGPFNQQPLEIDRLHAIVHRPDTREPGFQLLALQRISVPDINLGNKISHRPGGIGIYRYQPRVLGYLGGPSDKRPQHSVCETGNRRAALNFHSQPVRNALSC